MRREGNPGQSAMGKNYKENLAITKKTYLHKNLLGNEQQRAVDSIKHCEKLPPSEVT